MPRKKKQPNKKKKSKKKRQKKASAKPIRKSSTNQLLFWTAVVSLVLCLFIREYPRMLRYYQELQQHEQLNAYEALKHRITSKQQDFYTDWQAHPSKHQVLNNLAQKYVYNYLKDSIFDCWYGTTWDFNGTTQRPRTGKIACGYFVTTTLQHVGFRLPRRKMAQQAASVIIRSLCKKSSIYTLNNLQKLKQYMDRRPNGLYILGLDTHVGFLDKSAEGLHFIHASYSGNKMVSKEAWNASKVLSKSKLFVLGNLSGHAALHQKWIQKDTIVLQK